jgi:hypothetical protein
MHLLSDSASEPPSQSDTPEQMSLLRGRRYNRLKKSVPNQDGRNQHTEVNRQNDGQPNTAERLAQQHGVTSKTIKRDGQFAEAVEMLHR